MRGSSESPRLLVCEGWFLTENSVCRSLLEREDDYPLPSLVLQGLPDRDNSRDAGDSAKCAEHGTLRSSALRGLSVKC